MRTALAGLLLLGAFALPAAGATRASDPPRIVPWHLIGNLGLGMSHARVERLYGRAINGNPPAESIVWNYRGRGVIGVEYDREGNVEAVDTGSPAYTTRSGIHVGSTIPRGPCRRVEGHCTYHWRGLTYGDASGRRYAMWWRHSSLGGRLGVAVQLDVGADDVVDHIYLTEYLACPHGSSLGLHCSKPPKPPYFPPPAGTRYCGRPDFTGGFLAASPAVACSVAKTVEDKVFSPRCSGRTHCEGYRFRCTTGLDARDGRSFEDAYHAICTDGPRLRIEMVKGG